MNYGVAVDITGAALTNKSHTGQIDSAQLISQLNPIYVNESGDSMKGPLDMKGNKIINLPKPTSSSDASTKAYTDETIQSSFKNLVQELTSLKTLMLSITEKTKDEAMKIIKGLQDKISVLDKSLNIYYEADLLKKFEVFKQSVYALNDKLNLLEKSKSKYRQYHERLSIGENPLGDAEKTKAFEFEFPFKVSISRMSFQLTLLEQTFKWNDTLHIFIRNVNQSTDTSIKIEVSVFRSGGRTDWGLDIFAFLTITISDSESLPIPPNVIRGYSD